MFQQIVWTIIGCILWYIAGVSGSIYWHIKVNDLTYEDLLLYVCSSGLAGPLQWFIAKWIIDKRCSYLTPKKDILIKRRRIE